MEGLYLIHHQTTWLDPNQSQRVRTHNLTFNPQSHLSHLEAIFVQNR